MNMMKWKRRAVWKIVPGILLVLARGALAANITWSGGINNAWDISTSDNWSGDATKFNDGDNVIFNDSSTRTNVNVSTTVSPAAKTFANSTAKSYTLTNGTLSGTGNLTVNGGGNLNFGLANSATPNLPTLSFSGNTTISNGSKVALNYGNSSSGGQSFGLGSGTIILDNGHFGFANMSSFENANAGTSYTDILTNSITVNSGGGTLHTAGSTQNYALYNDTRQFSGVLTLNGNLNLDNKNQADGTVAYFMGWSQYVTFSGGVTVNGAWQINNLNLGTTYWDGSTGSTLTFTGPFSGSSVLTLAAPAGAVSSNTYLKIQAGADAADLLSAMRGAGGSIKITPGLPLQLVRGYFRIADFTGSGTNVLEIRQRSQIGGANVTLDTANGSDNTLHIGTAAGQFSTLYFNMDQNQTQGTVLNGAGAGNVQIENGGMLKFYAGSVYWQVVPGGNYRFMNGAILRGDYNNTESINQLGTANHYLGDGNNATPDTVTFSTGSYFILHELANRTWSQDNGVTIRYTVTANGSGFGWASTTTGGNNQQATLKVKNGAAGTEFSPPAGMTMYLAGPASGNVMELTTPARVIGAGTVEFKNNTAVSTYVLGPVLVSNTTFSIASTGTVRASAFTFTNAATYQVVLSGAASNQCGMLVASNLLTFASGCSVTVVPTNGFSPSPNQFWNVAYSTNFVGVIPTPVGGYTLVTNGAYLVLTKLSTAGWEPAIANVSPTNVQHTAAFLNGNLVSTGLAPVTVSVYWGPTDGGTNVASSTWANTNTFPGTQPLGYLSTNIGLSANIYYYYRYYATNAYGSFMADPVKSFITGAIDIQTLTNGAEDGPVTGLFSVARAAALTNEDLTVNYTVSGTASNGVDYNTLSGTVVIVRGQTNATIAVVPIPDSLVEGTEYATLTLLPGSYVVGTSPTATVSIADHVAKNLSWAGGLNGNWDTATANWTGDATMYHDGDSVAFNDFGTQTNVSLVGTALPVSVQIANAAKTYTFTNGALGGAGVLAVNGGGNVNFGVANNATPNPPALLFSGNSIISNGSRVAFAYSGSNQTNGIGAGAIVLDNGGIGIHMADNIWPSISTEILTNAITVSGGGGTLYTRGRVQDSWQNTRAFSGLLTLGGNLAIDNQNYATGPVDATLKVRPYLVNFTGGVTVNAGVQFVNTNLGYNGSLNISQITFGGPFSGSGMLTLTGAVGTTYRMQATADATDLLSSMRGSGGSIKIASGLPLQLVHGYFRIADFAGSGNNDLEIRQDAVLGGANVTLDTANGSDNTLHIGTAAGQFSTLYFNVGQNQAQGTVLNGAGAGNVQIENGGMLKFYAGSGVYWQVVPGGNYRFMNGSTLQGDYNNTESINQLGTANHYLGDGNNATPDTVTFSTGSYFILHELANRTWSQDNGVTLRYTVTVNGSGFGWANTTSAGNAQQASLPVKAGAAATEFAPLAGGSMYLAGPASGNVMTITNLAKLITAGTVEFKNNTAVSTYISGPIAITNGGTLAFATNGTVLASNVTFYTGSTQAVTVVGTASNAVGYLKVSGSLVFSNGVTLVGSNPSGFRALQGCWYVAEATTISGLPALIGFSSIEIEPGSPQRLKVFYTSGSVYFIR